MSTVHQSIPKTNGLRPRGGGGRIKVKSGCRTCKSRKVKCDEGRPACKRCESTGRSCEGYGIWGGGSRASETPASTQVPENSTPSTNSTTSTPSLSTGCPTGLPMQRVTNAELKSYEWFIGRSVFKLPGLFVPRFWTSILLQASTTEPAVLDAVLALSTIHQSETFITDDKARCSTPKSHRFMLQHYGKALGQLRPRSSHDDQATLRVTIIACVVFVYIDFLRGHYQAGLTHLHHGLKLMQQLPTSTTTHYRIQTQQGDAILDWAVEPLLRLYLQANLLGQLPEPLHPAYDGAAYVELPPVFNSLQQSRCYLDLLMSRILFLFHAPRGPSVSDHITKAAQYSSESQRILSQLRKWFSSANATMTKLEGKDSLKDRITFTSQLNFYIIATVMTEMLSQPSQMAYDAHTAGFITILERSVGMLKASTIPGIHQAILGVKIAVSPSEPVIDMGWLPGLFFIAEHCRVRRIRHHAVRLIHQNAHKEGMWDTDLTACLATEVVRIEETGYYPDPSLRYDFPILEVPRLEAKDDEPLLPEWCRIRELRVRLPDDPEGVLTLTYSRQPSAFEPPARRCRVYDLVTKQWNDVSK